MHSPVYQRRNVVFIMLFAFLFGFLSTLQSKTYTASSATEIKATIKNLVAGDTLLIATGNYNIGALWVSQLHGTAKAWIVIKGHGGMATLIGSKYENVINLDGVSYLWFENIAITTDGTYDGIDGVTFRSNSHHVTFKGCHIYRVTNVGINSQVPEIHHIVVSECEISHCAEVGIYWGYNDPLKVARDCIIERSYIHHCPTNSRQETGYGIQIKGGSYRNIIRDNVLHDVGGTTRAGMAVYYTNLSGGWSVADNNLVTGNVIWNVPNEGIYAAAGLMLENNIIFDAATGLAIYPYNGSVTENVIVRNNTIYRCRGNGLLISGWSNAGDDCIVINNASYMEDPAVDALEAKNRGNAIFANNFYYGITKGFGAGAVAGNSPVIDFVSARKTFGVPDLDFYPAQNSSLIDKGAMTYGTPIKDFNGISRPKNSKCDVGAYEYSTTANPGWKITKSFKITPRIPTSIGPSRGLGTIIPTHPDLLQNYPNPFNPSTNIRFNISAQLALEAPYAEVQVINIVGQLVKTLFNHKLLAEEFSIVWNGDNDFGQPVASGIYFCRLRIGREVIMRKMILL